MLAEKHCLIEFLDAVSGSQVGASRWLRAGRVDAFIRRSKRIDNNGRHVWCLDVASVNVSGRHRGRGKFRDWLRMVELVSFERGLPVFFENVLNSFLPDVLVRYGYVADQRHPLCFWKHPKSLADKVME